MGFTPSFGAGVFRFCLPGTVPEVGPVSAALFARSLGLGPLALLVMLGATTRSWRVPSTARGHLACPQRRKGGQRPFHQVGAQGTFGTNSQQICARETLNTEGGTISTHPEPKVHTLNQNLWNSQHDTMGWGSLLWKSHPPQEALRWPFGFAGKFGGQSLNGVGLLVHPGNSRISLITA